MKTIIDYSFIEKCIQKRICFAAYTLPNQSEFSMIVQRSAYPIKFDSSDTFTNHKGFIIAPFDRASPGKLLISGDFLLTENEINPDAWNFAENTPVYKKYFNDLPLATPRETYDKQFHEFISYINRRRAKKLVLSRVINTYKNPGTNYSELFKSLNAQYENTFNYLFYTPNSGLWMGASPEYLLRIDEEEACTVALAGTQKSQDIPLKKYVWGEKEKAEQQFVIDHIEKIIRKYIGEEKLKKHTRTINAAQAVHLETSYKFQAFKISLKLSDFLNELHPTPAVCGIPKTEALKIIRETEHHDREFYTGFLGPINIKQKTDLFVNLRCLKTDGDHISLFVGGGITAESQLQSEWDETSLKAQTLLSLIIK